MLIFRPFKKLMYCLEHQIWDVVWQFILWFKNGHDIEIFIPLLQLNSYKNKPQHIYALANLLSFFS